jgi:hypothetical protein
MGSVQVNMRSPIAGLASVSRGSRPVTHDVFISHAYRDRSIAESICQKLESEKISCWIAPRDVAPGEDWTQSVRNAIDAVRAFVVVISENANAALHVEREIANAFYARRIILPVRVGGAFPRRNYLFYLDGCRWFEWADRPGEETLEAFALHLRNRLFGLGVPLACCGSTAPSEKMAKPATPIFREGDPKTSSYRFRTISKRVAISGVVTVGLLFLARASQQVLSDGAQEPIRSSPKGGPSPQAKSEDHSSTPRYAFTRFGLWEPANRGPTPAQNAIPQSSVSENGTPVEPFIQPTDEADFSPPASTQAEVAPGQPDNLSRAAPAKPALNDLVQKTNHKKRHGVATHRRWKSWFLRNFERMEAMIRQR